MAEQWHGEGTWRFVSDTAINILMFGVDNSSSSHTDNLKNNFLVLGKGPTKGIYDSTGALEKN